jgi:2-keto-4-pentenoate hydratase/2-oxohepta-3-ene-1,7-dioic acid hydratase in catechol pathway
MIFARFERDGEVRYGAVDGGAVRELRGPPWQTAEETGRCFPLPLVRLRAPCAPSKIFALAFNYTDHLAGREPPREPQIFLKVPSSVIDPGGPIVLPPPAVDCGAAPGRIDEEAELVVVMGRRCRNATRANALSFVFGYTCGNDVSARGWQKADLNWWRAKSSDTFAPLGPFIATGIDPLAAVIRGRINGVEVQRCTPRDLLFDIPALIEWISRSVTLEPGDLIFTGTSGAPAELHAGDIVEVEIGGIGVLRNPVLQG